MSTTKVSTGLSNPSAYYLRTFYSNNRDASKSSKRNDFSHVQLAYEDSLALGKASHRLDSYEYTEDENEENIASTIEAYIDTYNNALDSAKDSDSHAMTRYSRQLKSLSSRYEDELSDIGVTINSDGKMKVNKNLLKSANIEDVKKVFGDDAGYTKKLRTITKHMSTAAYNEMFAATTGKGLSVNITL